MPREVSRRTSRPPETKAKVSYPDQPGKRDLDPKIVRDVPDPAIELMAQPSVRKIVENIHAVQREINEITGIARTTGYKDNNNGPDIEADMIQRGKDMDHYLENLGPQVDESTKGKG